MSASDEIEMFEGEKFNPAFSIDQIGRHYLVRDLNNKNVRRHYTTCNCLKKEAYDEYMNAIN